MCRHIESGKPYNGYLCQWDTTNSDVISYIVDKSIEVQVTHVPSYATAIYPSFRKAALSFAPDYITSGPTLKVFAENGKLFKAEFKITWFTNQVSNNPWSNFMVYIILCVIGICPF